MRAGLRALCLAAGVAAAPAAEPGGTSAYEAMGIKTADVLSGTVLNASVFPGGEKQVIALVTYLTGKKDEANAVNVRLEVFRRDGEKLLTAYARDFGKLNQGLVGRGELELVDLDGDSVKDIFVTYDDFRDKLITQRKGEVLTAERGSFRIVWSGEVEYDATRAARDVPQGRRDHYVRTLDPGASLKTRGQSVVFQKKTTAVAGERLPEAKETREWFPWTPGAPAQN
jgi:hypothetical protein